MELTVLKNGLRVALQEEIGFHSAAISIFIAAGNRYEESLNCGVSHFIEHMIFKGTITRSTADISAEADALGGQLNAYTAKEYTCVYSRALTEHVGRTLHLMCDMLKNPAFQYDCLQSEKGVILEEIGMYEDSPEDLCADLLTAVCYKNKPLGFNILGTRETVFNMTDTALREYMRKTYVPERMVVSVCGNFDKAEVLNILEQYFGDLKNTNNPLSYEHISISDGFSLCKKDIEQTQLSLCFNGLPIGHPLRFAASYFLTISGGAASSRLNRRIREELGLAYSAYSFSSNFLGTGMFGISAGLSHKNQEKFLVEGLKIINDTKVNITPGEMMRTKDQFKAGVALSNESLSSKASSMGRQLLLENKYNDIETTLERIENVTLEEVYEAARLLTDPSKIAVSVVGDARDENYYKNIIEKYI